MSRDKLFYPKTIFTSVCLSLIHGLFSVHKSSRPYDPDITELTPPWYYEFVVVVSKIWGKSGE